MTESGRWALGSVSLNTSKHNHDEIRVDTSVRGDENDGGYSWEHAGGRGQDRGREDSYRGEYHHGGDYCGGGGEGGTYNDPG